MNIVREIIVSLGFNANTQGVDQFERRINGIPNNVAPVINRLRNMFAGALAGVGVFEGIKSFVQAGDSYLSMQAKVASGLNESAGRTTEFMERIYQLSRQTGTEMDKGATAFARFAGAARQSGQSYEDAFALVETLQKSFILNGTAQSEAASVVLQVGQALSKGVFNDDEFKSFMENAGPLAEEFAKALGKTVPELRAMSTAGKLTTDIVFPALIRAGERFRIAFDSMPVTAGRALGIFKVTWTRFLADINLGTEASLRIGRAIMYISNQLEYLRMNLPVIGHFITDILGLTNIIETTGIALALAFGPSLIRMLWAGAAALAPWVAAGAVIGLLALTIQDLWSWAEGKDSIFGMLFKDSDNALIKMLHDALQTTEGKIMSIVTALGLARGAFLALGWFGSFMVGGGAAASAASAVAASAGAAGGGAAAAGSGAGMGAAGGALGSGFLFDALRRSQTDPAFANSFRIPSVDRIGPESNEPTRLGTFFRNLFGGSDFASRTTLTPPVVGNGLPTVGSLSPARSVTSTQTIEQTFNIQVPAADGTSLADTVGRAARSGAEAGLRLGDSMARALLNANPATEAGAR